jgi:hypothetical protein
MSSHDSHVHVKISSPRFHITTLSRNMTQSIKWKAASHAGFSGFSRCGPIATFLVSRISSTTIADEPIVTWFFAKADSAPYICVKSSKRY